MVVQANSETESILFRSISQHKILISTVIMGVRDIACDLPNLHKSANRLLCVLPKCILGVAKAVLLSWPPRRSVSVPRRSQPFHPSNTYKCTKLDPQPVVHLVKRLDNATNIDISSIYYLQRSERR